MGTKKPAARQVRFEKDFDKKIPSSTSFQRGMSESTQADDLARIVINPYSCATAPD